MSISIPFISLGQPVANIDIYTHSDIGSELPYEPLAVQSQLRPFPARPLPNKPHSNGYNPRRYSMDRRRNSLFLMPMPQSM